MKQLIWNIKLYQIDKHKYRVAITGGDPYLGLYGMKTVADGHTPGL